METITPTNEGLNLEKRKASFRTITFWITAIMCVSIGLMAFVGGGLGGGWKYYLVAGTAAVILISYKKLPSISLVLTLILTALFFVLDLRDMIHGKEAESSSFTAAIIFSLLFQIVSIISKGNKLDKVFRETSPLLLTVGLFVLSIAAQRIEDLIIIFLK